MLYAQSKITVISGRYTWSVDLWKRSNLTNVQSKICVPLPFKLVSTRSRISIFIMLAPVLVSDVFRMLPLNDSPLKMYSESTEREKEKADSLLTTAALLWNYSAIQACAL